MLATDSSPAARWATEAAIDLATATGWPLLVVAAWSVPMAIEAEASLHDALAFEDSERARAEEACARAVAHAVREGVQARPLVVNGDAASEICAVAERERAALVVVGAHSGRFRRADALGEVSAEVVRGAPCPVVVVSGGVRSPGDAGGARSSSGAVAAPRA